MVVPVLISTLSVGMIQKKIANLLGIILLIKKEKLI